MSSKLKKKITDKMNELDVTPKNEISLEGDTIISKIGKLTTSHSPRVN